MKYLKYGILERPKTAIEFGLNLFSELTNRISTVPVFLFSSELSKYLIYSIVYSSCNLLINKESEFVNI